MLSDMSDNSKKNSVTIKSTTKVVQNSTIENETNRTISPIHSVRVNKDGVETVLSNRLR